MSFGESINKNLPFRVSILAFIRNKAGDFLLLKRKNSPNKGCWSPLGGKLEMDQGESPFECAVREIHEEAGLVVQSQDLHLFSMISEKSYEGKNHWLLFLFDCHKFIDYVPDSISEGKFDFFSRESINDLIMPPSDHSMLWPIYDKYHKEFVALKADFNPEGEMKFILEGSHSVLQSGLPRDTVTK